MQMKTTENYKFTPIRMLLSGHQLISVGEGTEKMSTCKVLMEM